MNDSLKKEELTAIGIMLLGVFIASLNQTILSPALPSIMRDMHITASQGQWFTTVYLLVNGIMVPISAFLTERFSSRRLYLVAMAIFTVGTALAATSVSFFHLLFSRILQGLGFGVLLPLLINTIMSVFPPHKRGAAMGYAGIVFAGAPAIGPPLAGYIVDHWGWHATFLCVLPLLAFDLVLSFIFLKKIGENRHASLDWWSVALSSFGFGGLLFGFSISGTKGWLHPLTLSGLFFGVLVLIIFFHRQTHINDPLLRVDVFKFRSFNVGTAIGMSLNAALIASTIATPVFLQQVLEYSAFKSTLIFIPSAVFGMVASPFVGSLFDRHGLRKIAIVGLSFLFLGTALFLTFNEHTSFWYLMFVYNIRAMWIFVVMGPVNTWSLNALTPNLMFHGNAAATTLRQVAGSLGTAVIITIMTIFTITHQDLGFKTSTMYGFHAAFALASAIMLVALFLAIVFVKDEHQLVK